MSGDLCVPSDPSETKSRPSSSNLLSHCASLISSCILVSSASVVVIVNMVAGLASKSMYPCAFLFASYCSIELARR